MNYSNLRYTPFSSKSFYLYVCSFAEATSSHFLAREKCTNIELHWAKLEAVQLSLLYHHQSLLPLGSVIELFATITNKLFKKKTQHLVAN
jgi:hypothetical protein